MIKAIEENPQESRKEWLLWMMERAGKKNSNISKRQFWQQHNKPIELWSGKVTRCAKSPDFELSRPQVGVENKMGKKKRIV
tara:strand:+ start:1483 stop:1725 length:243 start_codon:yes stop_codon:yes gene_type:complete